MDPITVIAAVLLESLGLVLNGVEVSLLKKPSHVLSPLPHR